MAGPSSHLDRIIAQLNNKKMERLYQNSEWWISLAKAFEQAAHKLLG